MLYVLNTAFTAFNNDYRVCRTVSQACMADDLHEFGLQNIARCLGWALGNEQFREKIEASHTTATGVLTVAIPEVLPRR
jgi:hypothetical protein